MKKLILINCYFGTYPDYFKLFLKSCVYNKDIDFLLFTDQNIISPTANIRIVKISFQHFKNLFYEKINHNIVLDRPYKICDYKPSFGYVLQDYISDYAFWGHCDIDMILGRVMHFLPSNIFENFDKIYQHGHLCIYRNTSDNNRRFMADGGMNYQEVFATKAILVFDEIIGMQKKFEILGIPAYKKVDHVDISIQKYKFTKVNSWLSKETRKTNNYKYQVFFWEKGRVYRAAYINHKIKYDEFNYLHFPKRKFKNISAITDSFYITNKGIIDKIPGFNVLLEDILRYNNPYSYIKDICYHLRYIKERWKTRWNKYIKYGYRPNTKRT